MKNCICCNKEKDISYFYINKQRKDGHSNTCIVCVKKCRKKVKYTDKSLEWKQKKSEYIKKYYEENKEKIKNNNKEYRDNRKEENKRKKQENKEHVKEIQKNYRELHKKEKKIWNEENKDRMKNLQKEYSLKNKEKLKDYQREYYKNNSHTFVWRSILKHTMRILNQKKSEKTIIILGYSADDLKIHIEKLFTTGMSWDNHGEWHVDHIKPICSFDKNTQPSIVNELSNLRPLWATTREINGIVYEGNLNRPKYLI